MILFLLACERDPTFLGYWEVATLRVGATEGTAEEATEAGFIEFADGGVAHAMFSHVWSGSLVADPTPDLVTLEATWDEGEDFIDGYKSEGETYTMTISGGYEATSVYDVVDWAGSTVTLSSPTALPPGELALGSGSRMFVELDLAR